MTKDLNKHTRFRLEKLMSRFYVSEDPDLNWLSNCLHRITMGEDAKKVFNLKKKRGRPTTYKKRDREIARLYWWARDERYLDEEIREALGNIYFLSPERILGIKKRHPREKLKSDWARLGKQGGTKSG